MYTFLARKKFEAMKLLEAALAKHTNISIVFIHFLKSLLLLMVINHSSEMRCFFLVNLFCHIFGIRKFESYIIVFCFSFFATFFPLECMPWSVYEKILDIGEKNKIEKQNKNLGGFSYST